MGYLTHGSTAGGKTYDLLPCPHCGGEAEFRDGSSTKPYIRCKSCGCRTWGSHAYDKLAAAWNRRAERTCRIATMDMAGEPPYREGDRILNELSDGCSECGYPFDTPNRGTPNYCPNCGARVVDE